MKKINKKEQNNENHFKKHQFISLSNRWFNEKLKLFNEDNLSVLKYYLMK